MSGPNLDTPSNPNSTGATRTLAQELSAIPYEPLLPAEKWLIVVSLVLGVSLLGLLSWATSKYFPIDPNPKPTKVAKAKDQPAAKNPAPSPIPAPAR